MLSGPDSLSVKQVLIVYTQIRMNSGMSCADGHSLRRLGQEAQKVLSGHKPGAGRRERGEQAAISQLLDVPD